MNWLRKFPLQQITEISSEILEKDLRSLKIKSDSQILDMAEEHKKKEIIRELKKRKEYINKLVVRYKDKEAELDALINADSNPRFNDTERMELSEITQKTSVILNLLWYDTDWKPLKSPEVVINFSNLVATQLTFKWIPGLEWIPAKKRKRKKKK